MLCAQELYHPPDVEEAFERWGANCGPCALAAVLRKPLWQLRPILNGFESRHYMSPAHLRLALERSGARYTRVPAVPGPTYGLGFVQWTGPWTRDGVPIAVQYRYTHTIGTATVVEGPVVYDVNASVEGKSPGGWVPLAWWIEEIVPLLTAQVPRADGDFYVRWAVEVSV